MTLVIAWVRKISDHLEELVIASDSRLSGGFRIDCVPKILPLPRSDSVICFAGDTDYAYPLMLQMSLAIQSYAPSRSRAMDIQDMKGHVMRVFNNMVDSVHDYVPGLETPDVTFVLGGYSWKNKTFKIWSIRYNKRARRFEQRPAKNWLGGFEKIAFAGDGAGKAHIALVEMMRERYDLDVRQSPSKGFNMEPFEVLKNILRESTPTDSVGGPPQIVKIYQHMNCHPLGVYWPDKTSKRVFLLGRPLLDYENIDYWILDPDTLTVSWPNQEEVE